MKIEIKSASNALELLEVRNLFLEYSESLGFSLCFQGFASELSSLPGIYEPPSGRLLFAAVDGQTAGCGALHELDPLICEMKRLYVRPQFRGLKIGKLLATQLIAEARLIGYRRMRLDTIESEMQSAIRLYKHLGFEQIAPYRNNPVPGAIFMELDLSVV